MNSGSQSPNPDRDEFDFNDDAIIGRVFIRSLLVFAAVALLAAILWLAIFRGSKASEVVIAKDVTPPVALTADMSKLPNVAFRDVAAQAGLTVPHVSGADGGKLLPETMGGGAAFLDIDDDGDQDILLVSGTWWPGSDRSHEPTATRAYLNDGSGVFSRASAWDVGEGTYGTGIACGDWDADGRVDIFLASLGEDRLYRNAGNCFVDVTDTAGVAGRADAWSTSPTFVDLDGDTDLDLFVPHYIEWSASRDRALNFTLNGSDRAYGPPKQYEGTYSSLWINRGDGTFREAGEEAGLRVRNEATGAAVGKSLAVSPIDIDRDGDMDLVVANDTTRNFLFRNNGDATFEEVGVASGLAYGSRGNATGAMGIDTGHYRNDDALGIGIGNFANEMTSFYVGDDHGAWFTDEAVVEGIGSPTRPQLSFGLMLLDYDLDGRLDLFQTNGHLEEEINEVQSSQHYRQPAQLFWNAGSDSGPCFRIVPSDQAGDLGNAIVGRGAASADIDGDGDLDLLLTQPQEPPVLLRNDQALGHHWLRVKLDDPSSANRDAIGAWIELRSAGELQRRQVMPTKSYLSQVELPVTFGLGLTETVDSMRVIWPGGDVQNVTVPDVDVVLTVTRQSVPVSVE
ncbi:MAG: CRTAC1 family protein [Planctomycetes bacterium]|nr:CRTAC1 family protein [Planctomycetota bacterium]MCP4839583.1 CRTAC1 family protein [Planctomycetota bacterium]